MSVEGGCYCGSVRYKAEGDALFKGQCHCRYYHIHLKSFKYVLFVKYKE
jgi:hypothetical protein